MLAAIALKPSASFAISLGPPVGARAERSPAASCAEASLDAAERLRDPAREQEAGDDGRRGRAGRDGEHLPVGSHVEHHPAGGEHGAERDADRDEREPGELELHRRHEAKRVGDAEADREAHARDDEREADHGSNL